MGSTIYLSLVTWDLAVDINGNIAVASGPYALAQDAASACRLFLGELWYDTTQGVPYLRDALGVQFNAAALKTALTAAAKSVPGVTNAQVYFSSLTKRNLSGQVQIWDSNGVSATASF